MTEGLFIGIFVFAIVSGMVANAAYHYFCSRNEIKFNKTEYMEFEKIISDYFDKHRMPKGTLPPDILKHIKYTVDYDAKLPKGVEGRRDSSKKHIEINEDLYLEDRMFALAHEIAHDIRGDVGVATRDGHSTFFPKRSRDEQACDYIAAALLLPLEDMKSITQQYMRLSKSRRLRLIKEIAREKNVREEVVFRRIREVTIIIEEE